MRFQACVGDGEGDAEGWEKEMLVDPWEGEKEGRRKVFPRPKLPVGGALHLPGTGLS